MTEENLERLLFVALPERLISALLQLDASLNADLADRLRSTVARSAKRRLLKLHNPPNYKIHPMPRSGKYSAEVLGMTLAAWSLPELFAKAVDLTAGVAPEALDKLAKMSARKRRFVARNPEAIHPGRADLAVMQTRSGWWISKNIGQEDLKRALRALAQAAGLSFGEDVSFPSHHGSGPHRRT